MRATSYDDFERMLPQADTALVALSGGYEPPGEHHLPHGLKTIWAVAWPTYEAIAIRGQFSDDRGNCTNRKPVRLRWKQPPTNRTHGIGYIHPSPGDPGDWVSLWTPNMSIPCRKCDACRRAKQRLWERRARREVKAASRNWFVTLTFDPKLRPLDTQQEQWAFARSELTLYLKRVRATGAPLRYLAAFEAHKSGRPHIHLLIHEQGTKLTRRVLGSSVGMHSDPRGCWKGGFANPKLVRTPHAGTAAGYLVKYLHKSRDTEGIRVRASHDYGMPPPWPGTTPEGTPETEAAPPSGSPEATEPPPLAVAEATQMHSVICANVESSSPPQEACHRPGSDPHPPDRWEQFAVQLISTFAPSLRIYRRKAGDPEPSRKRWRKGDYRAFLTE